ncbi:MAG: PorV/PorQ family protein [Candidatus Eiseniibacteriota bacterium]
MSTHLAGRWGSPLGRLLGRAAAVLLASLLYATVRPAYGDVSIGGSSGSFLQFEVGGRPSGMGGAQVGAAAGITAQYWNPAALASLDHPQLGAMHATWLEDLNYEWVGYARPVNPKLGVASFSVAYFHLPSIDGVDDFGNPTGSFNVSDMAMTAGLARELGYGVSVGANLKLIRQNLADVSATGPAMDIGVMKSIQGTTIGFVAQNMGPGLSFSGSSSYPLPHQIRLGASRSVMQGRMLIATDYNMPSDYYDDVRVGAEYRAHPNISLRAGYRHEFGTGPDPADGLSFGLGLNFHMLNVDYAMTPDNEFSDVHRLSFGYSFGGGESTPKPEPKKPQEKKPQPPPAPAGPPIIARTEPKASQPAPKPAAQATEQPKAVASAPSPSPMPAPPAAPGIASAGVAPSSQPPAQQSVPQQQAPTPQPAPQPAPQQAPPKAETPKPVAVDYLVTLPGFSSKESAEAEIKALQLLGFKTKDAKIEQDPKRGSFRITLARMKSKGNADDMAVELQKMSFRAMVETVER